MLFASSTRKSCNSHISQPNVEAIQMISERVARNFDAKDRLSFNTIRCAQTHTLIVAIRLYLCVLFRMSSFMCKIYSHRRKLIAFAPWIVLHISSKIEKPTSRQYEIEVKKIRLDILSIFNKCDRGKNSMIWRCIRCNDIRCFIKLRVYHLCISPHRHTNNTSPFVHAKLS